MTTRMHIVFSVMLSMVVIVAVVCDRGDRYLSSGLFDAK